MTSLYSSIGMTPFLERLLETLSETDLASNATIVKALYAGVLLHPDEEANRVKVNITRLRHVLAPYGIVVENLRGKGYRLSPGATEKLLRLKDEAA